MNVSLQVEVWNLNCLYISFYFKHCNAVLGPVAGREERLGAGQSGHGGELSQVPTVRPGQGEAVPLPSALRQQVRSQRPLGAQRAHLSGKATRWESCVGPHHPPVTWPVVKVALPFLFRLRAMTMWTLKLLSEEHWTFSAWSPDVILGESNVGNWGEYFF